MTEEQAKNSATNQFVESLPLTATERAMACRIAEGMNKLAASTVSMGMLLGISFNPLRVQKAAVAILMRAQAEMDECDAKEMAASNG